MMYSAPLATLLLALPAPASANDIITSFEFDDQSGDFALGTAPLSARFQLGSALSTGNANLYHSGTHAWMVQPFTTAEVTFSVPAERLDFFFRDENQQVQSVVTVFDVNGSVLGLFKGTDLSWTQVTIGSVAQPVARITVENNFTGSVPFLVAIDDLTYCATSPIGTNYCGPAVPNSTGMPGVVMARGSTAAAFNSFTLTAQQLPAQHFGYFVNSMLQGFVQPPGSQGNLCLSGPLGRHAKDVSSTGADGVLVLVLDLTDIPTPGGPTSVLAGQTWNFQAWFRDKNPGPTSNFTDGISVSFN